MIAVKVFLVAVLAAALGVYCDGAPLSQDVLQSIDTDNSLVKNKLINDIFIPNHIKPSDLQLGRVAQPIGVKDKDVFGPEPEKSSPVNAEMGIAVEEIDKHGAIIKDEEGPSISLIDFLVGRMKMTLQSGSFQDLDVLLLTIRELSRNGAPFGVEDEVEYHEEVYCKTQACVDFMKVYLETAQSGGETVGGRWG